LVFILIGYGIFLCFSVVLYDWDEVGCGNACVHHFYERWTRLKRDIVCSNGLEDKHLLKEMIAYMAGSLLRA